MPADLARQLISKVTKRAGSMLNNIVDRFYNPPNPMTKHAIERAATTLADASEVLVCAGSGLSVESGVPTFRGEDGVYQDSDIARLTRASTFDSDRREMMQWYQDRRDQIDALDPNPGHRALVELAALDRNYVFATQNVDHLLEAAADDNGYRPPIYHLHGSLLEVRCDDCGYAFESLTLDLGQLPRCERCEGPLRPGVVWFGEALPEEALEHSAEAARRADACIVVGTSGLVHPAASLPKIARQQGATLIEINPNSSALSDICDILIRDKAGVALPDLAKQVRTLRD